MPRRKRIEWKKSLLNEEFVIERCCSGSTTAYSRRSSFTNPVVRYNKIVKEILERELSYQPVKQVDEKRSEKISEIDMIRIVAARTIKDLTKVDRYWKDSTLRGYWVRHIQRKQPLRIRHCFHIYHRKKQLDKIYAIMNKIEQTKEEK